jgi:hypothetical protein
MNGKRVTQTRLRSRCVLPAYMKGLSVSEHEQAVTSAPFDRVYPEPVEGLRTGPRAKGWLPRERNFVSIVSRDEQRFGDCRVESRFFSVMRDN